MHGLCVRVQTIVCSARWGLSSVRAWICILGQENVMQLTMGEKAYSVQGLFVPIQDNGIQLTIRKRQSPCMYFAYRSRTMVCRSRCGKSSLRAWTLCSDLEQWYVVYDWEKVVSVHGLCVLVQTMVCSSRRGKVISVHGFYLPVYDNSMISR